MYIAVLDEFPDDMIPILVAQAIFDYSLKIHSLKASKNATDLYYRWMERSFKKLLVRVDQKEFDHIAVLPDVGLFHENNTFEGKKACAVLVVDDEVPDVLKYAKLWKPKDVPCGH